MKSTQDRMRALLGAARRDDPPASVKGRVRAAVLAQVAAGALQGGSPGDGASGNSGAPGGGPGAGQSPGVQQSLAAGAAAKPAIMVSLGKAVIAAILTGGVGFAAGISVDRGQETSGPPAVATSTTGREAMAVVSGAGRSPDSREAITRAPANAGAKETDGAGAGSDGASDKAPRGGGALGGKRASEPVAMEPGSGARRAALAQPSKTGEKGTGERGTGGKGTGEKGGDEKRSDASRDSALSAELSLLREVQDALRSGDATRAESWLAEHETRYPDGVLREEREAARVVSLCLQGRRAEAKVAADRFLSAHPTSVQSERVRASCAFAEDAGAP